MCDRLSHELIALWQAERQRLAARLEGVEANLRGLEAFPPSGAADAEGAAAALSMAAGGSGVVHEDDGTGVIQLTGTRPEQPWPPQRDANSVCRGGEGSGQAAARSGKRPAKRSQAHKDKKKQKRAASKLGELMQPYDGPGTDSKDRE